MRLYPESNCKLYSNIDICADEQLAFSSRIKQTEYFNKHVEATFNDFPIVKKVNTIKLDVRGDVVAKCNYLSFKNSNFDNITFYAKIIDYDFTSAGCTTIAYDIDYWQTYMFDADYEDMDIDRQHLSESDWQKAEVNPYDPTLYDFLTPENLVVNKELEDFYTFSNKKSDRPYNFRVAASIYGEDGTKNMYLMFISAIDFENLDSDWDSSELTNKKPSEKWHDLMQNIINAGGVFSDINDIVTIKADEVTVNVELLSKQNRPYMIVGIPKSASNYCSDLLNYLTVWNSVSSLISVYDVPKFVVLSACQDWDNTILHNPIPPTINDKSNVSVQTFNHRIYEDGYTGYKPKSKKLCCAPYSYLRVITANEDIKEYRYEDFLDVREGGDTCNLRLISDLNAKPTSLMAPYRYKKSIFTEDTESKAYMYNLNKSEMVTFENYVESPYVTDSYLSAVAANLNSTVAQNTIETQDNLAYRGIVNKSALVSTLSNTMSMIQPGYSESGNTQTLRRGGGGSIFQDISAGAGLAGSVAGYGYNQGQVDAFNARLSEAAKLRSNPDVSIGRFEDTRAAYAADIFTAGSKGGCYTMISNLSGKEPCDFVINSVKLRDEVLERYDNYFIRYGYKTDAYGVPHVLYFVKGSTDTTKVPHWETVDGKPCTFVKTLNARVTHSLVIVQDYIETMLNSGIRMIKGDDL